MPPVDMQYYNERLKYYQNQQSPSVPAPQAPKPSSPQSSGYGAYTPSAYTAPAPSYVPAPARPAMSYTGQANVIGNVGSSADLNKSYQGIYDSLRANDPTRNEINTFADNSGNVYDTTKMTPQQIFALSLYKNGNTNASAVLKGMGLDMNGNPTNAPASYSGVPAPAAPSGGFGGSMAASSSYSPSMQATTAAASPSNVPAPKQPNASASGYGYVKNPTVDSWDTDKQLEYYAQHPEEAAQEIQRAQGVNSDAAKQWVGLLQSAVGTPRSNVPAPSQGFAAMTPEQIKAEAEARVNALISSRSLTANQQKQGLQTSFANQQKVTNDTRTLENVQNARNLSPFSGRSDYAQGMIGRERAITDRQGQEALTSQLGNIDAQTADYINSQNAQLPGMIDELTARERGFNIQEGQLTGDYNGQRTVAGQQLDYTKSKDQRDFDYGKSIDDRNFTYQQARDEVKDQQYKQTFDEDARRWGMDYALKKAVDMGQLDISRINASTSAKNAETSRISANNSIANGTFNQLMDVWKASGKAPAGLESYGIQQGMSFSDAKPKDMSGEIDGLYSGLQSGQIDPASALDEINQKEKVGIYTQGQAVQLRSVTQQFANNSSSKKPMPQLTPSQASQIEQSGGKNYQSMNENQLQQEWQTDPTGEKAGTAMYDWIMWAKDPRGRMAGTSYQAYQQAYGPRLGQG